MQNGHRLNRVQRSRFTSRKLHVSRELAVSDVRYRHILVSLTLNPADHDLLLLGFELATLHQARLTLLHVLPQARNGLDAIGLLHNAAETNRYSSTASAPRAATRSDISDLVHDIVPQHLRSAVRWKEKCRPGRWAETLAAEANESGADLVILPAQPLRGWLQRAFDVWTIRRRARNSVIVVRQ